MNTPQQDLDAARAYIDEVLQNGAHAAELKVQMAIAGALIEIASYLAPQVKMEMDPAAMLPLPDDGMSRCIGAGEHLASTLHSFGDCTAGLVPRSDPWDHARPVEVFDGNQALRKKL